MCKGVAFPFNFIFVRNTEVQHKLLVPNDIVHCRMWKAYKKNDARKTHFIVSSSKKKLRRRMGKLCDVVFLEYGFWWWKLD